MSGMCSRRPPGRLKIQNSNLKNTHSVAAVGQPAALPCLAAVKAVWCVQAARRALEDFSRLNDGPTVQRYD